MAKEPGTRRCPHFGSCSGCTLGDASLLPPIALEISATLEFRGIPLRYWQGQSERWRCRAKLAVRQRKGKVVLGLFEQGTHRVIPIPHCCAHFPEINEAVAALSVWMEEEGIRAYDERTQDGELRYVQLAVERSTRRVQLALVISEALEARADVWMKRVARLKEMSKASFWHSIWFNENRDKGNAIFGSRWQLAEGAPYLWEEMRGTKIAFTPACFGQANLDLFESILDQIALKAPEGSSVVEYYAGVGLIGLTLASSSQRVFCCEINPHAERCFLAARDLLPKEMASRLSFFTGEGGNHLSLLEDADVVVVDPPRKGLDPQLITALRDATRVQRVIYVSCCWPSLWRDLEQLSQGGWQLQEAHAFLLFPGTNHMEILGILERPKKDLGERI